MLSLRRKPAGLAIVTALFVVMVLYVLVTVTVGQAQMNQHLTREAHLKVQANFLAQAAVQLSLKQLNEIPGWEDAHLGQAQADAPDLGSGDTQVWIDRIDLERLRVKARVDLGGVVVTSSAVVKKQHPVDEMSFARLDVNNKPDGVYRRLGSAGGSWESLPPSPARYWTGDATSGFTLETATYDGVNPKYCDKLLELSGDADGNLYGIWRRGPADEIVRYRATYDDPSQPPAARAAAAWDTLPPVPNIIYNSAGVPYDRGNRPDNLERLCVGDKALYVVNQRDNLDTIFRMDLEALNDADPSNDQWSTLPPIPKRKYDDQGNLSDPNGFAGNANDLTADREGRVYVRYAVDDHPDTICVFEPGGWKYLPPAPKKFYAVYQLGFGGLEYVYPEDAGVRKFAGNLKDLSADPDGNLYGRYERDGIDTLFKFSRSPEKPERWRSDWRVDWYNDPTVVGGTWTPLPPAPQIYYDFEGRKTVEYNRTRTVTDPATGEARVLYVLGAVARNMSRAAVDKGGTFLAQWPLEDRPDTLFRYDLEKRSWDAEKPVPQKRFQADPATNVLQAVDDARLVNKFKSLGGGGLTDRTRWEYRIRSSFP